MREGSGGADTSFVGDAYGSHGSGAAVLPAAIGPAFALIGTRGGLERATTGFRERFGDWIAAWDDNREELYGLIREECEHATVTLWGPEGSVAAEAECLFGSAGERYLLLSVRPGMGNEPRAGPEALIGPWLDEIPAIVWLKDLEGHYLRVNRAYSQALGIEPEEITGRTDTELAIGQAVDGPRLHSGGARSPEPLEFEYTVAAFESRPALAALRFAVRDSSGAPVAVCGVAAPVSDAAIARAECARLMQIERWSRLGDDSIRADVIAEWGLSARGEQVPEPGESEAAATPTYADSELAGELERVRAELEQVTGELEHAVADLDAARTAATEAGGLLVEERRRTESLHHASELAARRAHELLAELAVERERREEGERDLEQTRTRLGELEATLAEERARAGGVDEGLASRLAEARAHREKLERALAEERQRLGAELDAARASAADVNGLLAEERRRIESLQQKSEAAERRAGELLAELTAERERREAGERAIEQSRARLGELEAALADSRAQAGGVEEGLARQLAEERAHRAEMERALADDRARMADLESAVGEERARREELEREKGEDRTRREELEWALGEERARREELERAVGEERARRGAELDGTRSAATAAEHRAQELQAELSAERERRDERERAHEQSRARLGELEAALAHDRAEAGGVEAELARAEAQRVAAEQTLAGERTRIAELESTLSAGHERIAELERTLVRERERSGAADAARAERAQAAVAAHRARAERAEAALSTQRAAADQEAGALRREVGALRERVQRERREAEGVRARFADATARLAPAEPVAHAEPPSSAETEGPVPELRWRPAAQHHLTATLTGASEWRTGLRNAVRIIGAEGGWDAVTAWLPEARKAVLRCTAMWTGAASDLGPFETLTWQKPQPIAGELGRALVGPHPTWLSGLDATDDVRGASAAREGMRSALLVPIHYAGKPIGVLELLTRASRLPDAEIAISLEAVAVQLGHFAHLMRLGAEPHWRTRL